jgi:hypothetical protein
MATTFPWGTPPFGRESGVSTYWSSCGAASRTVEVRHRKREVSRVCMNGDKEIFTPNADASRHFAINRSFVGVFGIPSLKAREFL